MEILVDFDNLDYQSRRGGLENLCTRIINSLANSLDKFPDRARVKLYGGWYENDDLTNQAEELIAAIARLENAIVVHWKAGGGQGKTLVQMEMAYGLEIDPSRRLFHTLRTRPFSDSIKCNDSRIRQCREMDCPLTVAANVFKQKRCTVDHCRTTPGDIFKKSEQKLVDTMLTADLIYLGQKGRVLAIVSSDDDIWPGIQTALFNGAYILQLRTQSQHSQIANYSTGLMSFTQLMLS